MASKKVLEKNRQKIVEDKTFGLKNKNKSKKVQQYVQQVQKNAAQAGQDQKAAKQEQRLKEHREKMRKLAAEQEKEMGDLFKAAVVAAPKPQVAEQEDSTVDPKTIFCGFFKQGTCKKGKKCKFSHDPAVERKVSKINMYVDPREADTMDKWDQNKLEEVVNSKDTKKGNETKIICKYFIEAIEQLKYGWFWKCPNGEACIYQHKLPPGFVLKTKADVESQEDAEEGPTIEEEIELERRQLDLTKCTPVTAATFAKWKEERQAKREAAVEERRKQAAEKNDNKGYSALSGRDLFRYDPSLFVDDEGAADEAEYEVDESFYHEDDGKDDIGAINPELFAGEEDIPEEDEDDEGEEGANGDADEDADETGGDDGKEAESR